MVPDTPDEATCPNAGLEPGTTVMTSAPVFDAICRTARALFAVPCAQIRLDEETRRWAVPEDGPDSQGGGAASSFCEHVREARETLVIDDASRDPRFAADPAVAGPTGMRFHAGSPLLGTRDDCVGSLCVADTSVRTLTGEQRHQLDDLAQIAASHLRLLADLREASRREALYRLLAENSTDTIVRGNLDGVRLYISPAVRTLLGYEPEELIGRKASELVHPDDAEDFARLMRDVRHGRIDVGSTEQRQRRKGWRLGLAGGLRQADTERGHG
jgi:PAS domain S-box-containing protein